MTSPSPPTSPLATVTSTLTDGSITADFISYVISVSFTTDLVDPLTPKTLPVATITISTALFSIPSTTSANPSPTTTTSTSLPPSSEAPTSIVSPSSQFTSSSAPASPITRGSTPVPSSSTPAPTSTATPTPSKSSSNTGYIAAIAVLAVLLGIALLALAFLRFRKRRNPKHAESIALMNDELKIQSEPKVQIAALERQLHDRDNQLRANQAALLQQGRSVAGDTLDDRQVSQRFGQLNKSIRDWAVGNFKSIPGNPSISRDTAALLQGTQPNYRALLDDPRTKYLVLRSLVAEVLVQAFKSGELLGSPAYSELDSWVRENGAAQEVSEWRTQTMTLLEKSPAFRVERASSVQEIGKRISFATADVAGLPYSELRAAQMQKIVEGVAALASELTRQKSTYEVGMERASSFDPASMEDALQDHGEEKLLGRNVKCVVFPAVRKWEDGVVRTGGMGRVISRAQVLT